MAIARPSKNIARIRLVIWALVFVTAILATIAFIMRPAERPLGVFGGDFQLQSTAGGDFGQADLVGTPSLLFFGFTYCPDVCPTTLVETVNWRQQLELSPEDLRLIFATVDPERDTLETLEQYLSAFDPSIIGLTGSLENVANAKKAFGVYSAKVDDADSSDYLIDHTASVFLIGADGNFKDTISYGEASDIALSKIRKLIES